MANENLCPNVFVTDKEAEALEQRYSEAKSRAAVRGVDNLIEKFEQLISEDSYAVINAEITVLYRLVKISTATYKNCHDMGLCGERRKEVDTMLFKECKEYIRYATLSLDGWGLTAYGKCCFGLKRERIAQRTSLLEENSFNFVQKHPSNRYPSYPPLGYRANWPKRSTLAVTKLADKILPETQEEQFAQLLLKNTGKKDHDEFIEVHICGGFTCDLIDWAGVMCDENDLNEDDKEKLKVIRKKLEKKGVVFCTSYSRSNFK